MPNAIARLELELTPGERILWAGQPIPGIRFNAADFFLIPFSLFWLGFAIFWTVMAARITDDSTPRAIQLIFPLFGVPFILIGLYLTVGRFWQDVRLRAQTYYGITSQRIILLHPSKGVQSIDLKHISDFTVDEGRNGEGTIWFTPQNIRKFDRIAGVRQVESILRNAHDPHRAAVPG